MKQLEKEQLQLKDKIENILSRVISDFDEIAELEEYKEDDIVKYSLECSDYIYYIYIDKNITAIKNKENGNINYYDSVSTAICSFKDQIEEFVSKMNFTAEGNLDHEFYVYFNDTIINEYLEKIKKGEFPFDEITEGIQHCCDEGYIHDCDPFDDPITPYELIRTTPCDGAGFYNIVTGNPLWIEGEFKDDDDDCDKDIFIIFPDDYLPPDNKITKDLLDFLELFIEINEHVLDEDELKDYVSILKDYSLKKKIDMLEL